MTRPETPEELRLDSDRRLAISVVAILLCLNLVMLILNLQESGPQTIGVPAVVIVRLVGVFVAAAVTAAFSLAKTDEQLGHVSLAGSLAVAAMLLVIQVLSPASDAPAFAFDLVLVPTMFVALPARPKLQLIPALTLTGGALALLFRPDGGFGYSDEIRYAIFFACAVSLGYVAASRRHRLWQDLICARQAEWDAAVEADRARTELQTLRGIIPICSHCHRVRLEEGHLWEAVDMYVSRRTDAAFSHGVCPDCLTEHYPQVRPE